MRVSKHHPQLQHPPPIEVSMSTPDVLSIVASIVSILAAAVSIAFANKSKLNHEQKVKGKGNQVAGRDMSTTPKKKK